VYSCLPLIRKGLENGILGVKQECFQNRKFFSSLVIHTVEVVERRSMYGFLPDSQIFVKVSFKNPSDVPHAVTALEVLITLSFIVASSFI
jgi:hypothetical protein